MEWRWLHFSEKEMACHCCGKCEVNEPFMDRLEKLRKLHNKPMNVTSGYRCSKHDKEVGGKGNHTTGCAVDISVASGNEGFYLLKMAMECGFTGIGVKLVGSSGRFIHLDSIGSDSPDTRKARPAAWSY